MSDYIEITEYLLDTIDADCGGSGDHAGPLACNVAAAVQKSCMSGWRPTNEELEDLAIGETGEQERIAHSIPHGKEIHLALNHYFEGLGA